jgi:voltage-gated potassium channel
MRHGGERAALAVMRWNIAWLSSESVIALALTVATAWLGHNAANPWLYRALALVALYRVDEIFYAFFHDASSRLSSAPQRTPLTPAQRINQAMRSYASLTINFAVIAFEFPSDYYYRPIVGFVDALYFSGTTISTLGYGDIKPMRPMSEIFSVYEVFAGILLVVVALGVYFSRLGSNNEQ